MLMLKQTKTFDRIFSFIDQSHSFNSRYIRQTDIACTDYDSWKMEVLWIFGSWNQKIVIQEKRNSSITNP